MMHTIIQIHHSPEEDIPSSPLWIFDTEQQAIDFRHILEQLDPDTDFEIEIYDPPMHNPTTAIMDKKGNLKVIKIEDRGSKDTFVNTLKEMLGISP